jgi:SAM-dependent methyltransferase
LVGSEVYADDHHWGDQPVDIAARDLPALKTRFLIQALPVTGRVVEIGCGGGRILKTISLHRPGLELHGYDIRPLAHAPAQFSFHLGDPNRTALPLEAGSFDAVIMSDILEHLVDPGAMLHAARIVLAPGGRLVSFSPLEGQYFSFYRLFRRCFGDDLYVETKEHIQAFSERSLVALVERDFQIVHREYAYHLLGHLMDATLFALVRMPRVRERFWTENPYYEESDLAEESSTSLLGNVLRLANVAAYEESHLLRNVRWTAAGLLFEARAR